MRLIIAGSRSISGTEADLAIREALVKYDLRPTEIISGGAKGVDAAARRYAEENGVDFVEFPANWRAHGKAAGYKRNTKMAWYARQAEFYIKQTYPTGEVDSKYTPGLLAVWDGSSRGTENMIEIARKEHIRYWIFNPPNEY